MNEKEINAIKNASPLDLPKVLINMELYDAQRAKDLFDDVNEQFDRASMEENIILPVFTTITDAILDLECFHGVTKKLGLSSNRVVGECRNFNYEGKISMLMPDSFVENRQQQVAQSEWAKEYRASYVRSLYEDKASMKRYKEDKIIKNGRGKNISNEYTDIKDITEKKKNPDLRRNDPKNEYNAETDHIVPLKHIFKHIQTNAGLSDDDIRNIANNDYNYALTSRKINNAKRDMTNAEFIRLQDEKKARGEKYIELSNEVRQNMPRMEREANKQINKNINSAVIKNLTGRGKADIEEINNAIKAQKKQLGRDLTPKETEIIQASLARKKAKAIHQGNIKSAGKQTLGYALGSLILMMLKPLYYEIKDGFLNGFKEGVDVPTYKEAFKVRFARVKNYISSQICNLKNALGNIIDTLKNFISALIEGLISMFVGILKKIFRVLKEGIKVFMQVYPILFGKESKQMTKAQKGDAIVKILGGSVVSLCGIGIEMLLNKVGFLPNWLRGAVSTLLSGLASALMFYALDKADLFNVKADLRNQRIDEIFSERIKSIERNTHEFDSVATEALKNQIIEFNTLMSSLKSSLSSNDLSITNSHLLELSQFLGLNLGYTNQKEFENKYITLNWNL